MQPLHHWRVDWKALLLLIQTGLLLMAADAPPTPGAAPSQKPAVSQNLQIFASELAETRRKAEAGDAVSQCALGLCYYHGTGVPKDDTEAVKWYRKAADQGNAKAQYNLGVCYSEGDGVPKDAAEAVKWYHKAADQGNVSAQFQLGFCYDKGKGVTKDSAVAAKWYRRAAEQGDAQAQCNLGVCYANGEGVSKDAAEAAKWFRKAAEQGNAQAQGYLGSCYASGDGVLKDQAEAVKWFRKAAEQGFADAQFKLGACYAIGQGVPKDLVEAYRWWNLAAAKGIEEAKKWRDQIERLMTPDQIAEGQRLARDFQPKKTSTDQTGRLVATEGAPDANGTGFFISADGYLITNQHVVAEAEKVAVVCASGRRTARVVHADAANDLALLKVEGTFAPLALAPSGGVKLAATVFTVGFPNPDLQGFQPKFARGDIAGLAGAGDDPRFFQISVPVQPGNSGGPLVDERGNVVGVVTAKLSVAAAVKTSGALPENVNYALKGVFISTLLDTLSASKFTLIEPHTKAQSVEETAKTVEASVALVLVWK
jgi:TPR repeat protein/S1-C subfamily serine protease